MKAELKRYRQSPQKVRLVTDLIKGMKVNDALLELKHTPKRASHTIEKLINSAVANSKSAGEELYIKDIQVNEGPTLKRIRRRSRGSANVINKRTSHIFLALGKKQS